MNAVEILVDWLNNEFSTKVEVIDRLPHDKERWPITWVFIEIPSSHGCVRYQDCGAKLRLDIGNTSVKLVVPDSIACLGLDKSYDFNLYDPKSIEDLKSRIHTISNMVKEDVN